MSVATETGHDGDTERAEEGDAKAEKRADTVSALVAGHALHIVDDNISRRRYIHDHRLSRVGFLVRAKKRSRARGMIAYICSATGMVVKNVRGMLCERGTCFVFAMLFCFVFSFFRRLCYVLA